MSSQSVSVSTVVNPPYSPYLSDYTNLKDRTVITLINNENNTKQVYLKARFYNNNGFIAQTIEEYRPVNPIFLNPNVTYQLPANDLPSHYPRQGSRYGGTIAIPDCIRQVREW